jgi:hypothetical protein
MVLSSGLFYLFSTIVLLGWRMGLIKAFPLQAEKKHSGNISF